VRAAPTPDATFFLGTIGADGKPHAAGVGCVWQDGDLFFTSGPAMRKARDLAVNPTCTFSVRLSGIDLVLEGSAIRTTDAPTLQQIAAKYRDGGWPAEVAGDALTAPFSAPSAGPPPWNLYRFAPQVVTGVATTEPHGATRWTF
ncbi:MAG: pyridoxamine 5'-phosphate oxidase family protein, partial [Candidatus Dormibacteraeota bacterium]|nr:pyridoxamine 5'-phosphate oxidase family protein [Candidatus Dormibacteraeota bacterium]